MPKPKLIDTIPGGALAGVLAFGLLLITGSSLGKSAVTAGIVVVAAAFAIYLGRVAAYNRANRGGPQ